MAIGGLFPFHLLLFISISSFPPGLLSISSHLNLIPLLKSLSFTKKIFLPLTSPFTFYCTPFHSIFSNLTVFCCLLFLKSFLTCILLFLFPLSFLLILTKFLGHCDFSRTEHGFSFQTLLLLRFAFFFFFNSLLHIHWIVMFMFWFLLFSLF